MVEGRSRRAGCERGQPVVAKPLTNGFLPVLLAAKLAHPPVEPLLTGQASRTGDRTMITTAAALIMALNMPDQDQWPVPEWGIERQQLADLHPSLEHIVSSRPRALEYNIGYAGIMVTPAGHVAARYFFDRNGRFNRVDFSTDDPATCDRINSHFSSALSNDQGEQRRPGWRPMSSDFQIHLSKIGGDISENSQFLCTATVKRPSDRD